MQIQKYLNQKIYDIGIKIGAPENFDPIIQINNKNDHIDYQSNGIIKISKFLKEEPYKLAQNIANYLKLSPNFTNISVSKPGFINIYLSNNWLTKKINSIAQKKNLNITTKNKKIVIIDYSSPNIAKELHIGHLRSTILGDTTVRIMEFLGHKVIKQNHIGDWGTQFGILIAYIYEKKKENHFLDQLEYLYQKAYKKYTLDKKFAEKTNKYVVKLQKYDKKCLYIWNQIVNQTIKNNQKIYKRLNVKLRKKDIFGESFYNFMLPEIIKDLQKKYSNPKIMERLLYILINLKIVMEKKWVLLLKKNGAFLYTTTDIACLKYRYEKFHANKIIYYTDKRQEQHLLQVWLIAKKAGYIPNDLILEHHTFGMILCKNKKPFKTRDGNIIKLKDLLNEGVSRAKLILKKKFTPNKKEIDEISEIIGIGAIKYFDLSKNRKSNYIFDWDQMLSLTGNTAPYIQYAYTRIQSILNKFFNDFLNKKNEKKIKIFTIFERKLVLKILQFEELIYSIEKNGTPHLMCNYLYELSGYFSNFYENCNILNSKKK
ncbi:arginyl-tRNA synthetase [Buchnera aphidicola (Cinara tujafilina)]|uniref:Arginine--tRNA ligase n=1 Tax=Buchnera aphidicola (Cinara tujafilina) TaxID=261317 RepID=F7WZ90_9GAMM|nr:arginine--tRNA ligase [Buchnera aphidicola]AEH39744.1 arginyl-tRNA synthetase [Buchnera aphidicola (Cinara tujafilina)]